MEDFFSNFCGLFGIPIGSLIEKGKTFLTELFTIGETRVMYLSINIECLLFVLHTNVKPDSKNLAFLTEYLDRIVIEKIGRKHLLSIRNLDENRDAGTYTCHASNPVGEYKENFHVQGVHLRIVLS